MHHGFSACEATKRSCWVHPPAAPREARNKHSKTAYARIRGDAPRWPPMASAAVAMGLGRESRAETRRRGDMSKNSASLRLCGRINPLHRETPNRRVSRRRSLDLPPSESRLAACQHAVVADGMNPVLSTHAPAFFVSSCPRESHSPLPDSRDRPTRRCFFDHTTIRAKAGLG